MPFLFILMVCASTTLQCKEITHKKEAPSKAMQTATMSSKKQAAQKESAKKEIATQQKNIEQKQVASTAIEKQHTIMVANNITDEMITYKAHITGPHTPSSFSTYANGTEIKPGATASITVPENKKLHVACKYEFKKGWVHVKKEREKEITVDPHDKVVSVQFSWDNDDRIILRKDINGKQASLKS